MLFSVLDALLSRENKMPLLTWKKNRGSRQKKHLNIKSMFFKKLFSKRRRQKAVVYILIQAPASQYWITHELLWCFCMQHMIYYCTFCCTIRASEDIALIKKKKNPLLCKHKLLLFLFFHQAWFISKLFATSSCQQHDILATWGAQWFN